MPKKGVLPVSLFGTAVAPTQQQLPDGSSWERVQQLRILLGNAKDPEVLKAITETFGLSEVLYALTFGDFAVKVMTAHDAPYPDGITDEQKKLIETAREEGKALFSAAASAATTRKGKLDTLMHKNV
jgi:hypothetical protein